MVKTGGEREIRTLDTLAGILVFETSAFNHSATSPRQRGLFEKTAMLKDGKKDGPWVIYYKDGTVLDHLTGTFKNGVKVK